MILLTDTIEVSGVEHLISNLGFPIFCVLALGYFVWKSFQSITSANQEREKRLYDTINDLRGELIKATETNRGFLEVLEQMKSDLSNIREDVDDLKKDKKTVTKKES